MFTVYSPQLDVLPLLNHDQEATIKYYWDFRWVVELGRIDIHVKGALLYCYLFQPQKVNLDKYLHIFSYLKRYLILGLCLIIIQWHGMIVSLTKTIRRNFMEILRRRYIQILQRQGDFQTRRIYLWIQTMLGTACHTGHTQCLPYS